MGKKLAFYILLGLWTALTACGPDPVACPNSATPSGPGWDLVELIAVTPKPGPTPVPITVEIAGRQLTVDRVVSGPLCNDHWSGVVYVSCDAQVAEWEQDPLFFKGCNLEIDPGTVVYVGAHFDTAYYKGCSCHTGEDPIE